MDEDNQFVVDTAKTYKLADEELIDLYDKLQLLVYGNQEKYGYECSGSGIGFNQIDFSIIMPKGVLIPQELTALFFDDIDYEFKVECKRKPKGIYNDEVEDAYGFEIGLF